MPEFSVGSSRRGSRRRSFPEASPATVFLILSAFFLSPTAAAALRPQARLLLGTRVNLRSTEESVPNEILQRAELDFTDAKRRWHLLPFFETRWDWDHSQWSRKELGLEVGVALVSWLYLASGLQAAEVARGEDHPEWELRAVFTAPLPWSVRNRPATVYALNEFTVDLDDVRALRNEVGVGVELPLPWERWSTRLGWRHVDPIHEGDMDQLEASVILRF